MSQAPPSNAAPGHHLHAKVLVADPDIECVELYAAVLGLSKTHVTHVSDGRDALAKLFEYRFSLIITETDLPFIDGYALCQLVRRDVETRHIPIIVVTANPRPVALTRAVQAGADVALLKPCGPDALLGEAQRLMMSPRGVGAPSYGLEENKRAPAVQPPSPFEPAFKTKRHVTSRTYKRYATSTPSVPPPALRCASCDRSLTYERSEIGGVTPDDPEQWDYYQCPTGCGRFQYRQRTRKLRLA